MNRSNPDSPLAKVANEGSFGDLPSEFERRSQALEENLGPLGVDLWDCVVTSDSADGAGGVVGLVNELILRLSGATGAPGLMNLKPGDQFKVSVGVERKVGDLVTGECIETHARVQVDILEIGRNQPTAALRMRQPREALTAEAVDQPESAAGAHDASPSNYRLLLDKRLLGTLTEAEGQQYDTARRSFLVQSEASSRRQFEIETMMKELERDRPQIEKLIERYRD